MNYGGRHSGGLAEAMRKYATGELEVADAPHGAGVSSDDQQTKYRVERHASGGVTYHRRDHKPSKAERKAAARARRLAALRPAREMAQAQHTADVEDLKRRLDNNGIVMPLESR